MFKRVLHFAFIFCSIFGAVPLHGGEIIDRIVATVNGHIILQSDVDQAISYQALAGNQPLAAISQEQRKAALDRLIDLELIREEVHSSDFQAASAAEIDARIAQIRKAHVDVRDDASWLVTLRHYGLIPDELRQKVTADLNSWKAIDARLRPSVAVDSRSIERYYQQNLLPELRRNGAQEVPLVQVAPQIKEILAQQQINDLLVAWLKSLRTESNIQIAAIPSLISGGGER